MYESPEVESRKEAGRGRESDCGIFYDAEAGGLLEVLDDHEGKRLQNDCWLPTEEKRS